MSALKPALAAMAIAAATLAAVIREPPEKAYLERVFVFGSLATLELRHTDEVQARTAIAAVAQRWQSYHRDWHPWEDGALTRLNAALRIGQQSEPLPASLIELIALGHDYESESGGLVNPALGRMVALWGFHTSDFPVRTAAPSEDAVAQLVARQPSMRDVRRIGDRAVSDNPAVQLDFSAIAEGLALRHAATILRDHRVRHALLSLGGDVLALGRNGNRAWRVAIRNPEGGTLAVVDLADGEALFSSGTYSRFREDPDGRWPHLIDPRHGSPLQGMRASAVLHRDPVRADAAATAIAIGGADSFAKLIDALKLGCALLLDQNGTLRTTPGMAARMRLTDTSRAMALHGAERPCDG